MKSKALRALFLHVDKIQHTPEFWQARAHIAFGLHWVRPSDDLRFLSADCAGPTEVCAAADDLIRELEAIKQEARAMAWNNRPSNSN
jgi:hypothetical protein